MSAQVTDRLPGGRGGRAGRGRGAGGPVEIVADMRKRGFTDEDIRAHLKALGYKSPRISQVMMKKKEPAASEPPPPLASGDDPEIPLGGTETPIAAAPSPSPGDFHSDESDGDPPQPRASRLLLSRSVPPALRTRAGRGRPAPRCWAMRRIQRRLFRTLAPRSSSSRSAGSRTS